MFKTTALDSVANAYVDKDVSTSTPGTRLEADDRNIIQDELVNAIEGAKLTLDPTGVNRDQLLEAILVLGDTANAAPGLVIRPKFTYVDADQITIEPFVYHHHGTSEQLVYCDSQLNYTFANLAVSDWSYLYLDDSAIVTAGTNLIAVGQLIDLVTSPTWNAAKHGWYNGEDRCIFAVLTDGSSNILEFFHSGGTKVFYADSIADATNIVTNNVWTDAILTIPSFATEATVQFSIDFITNSGTGYWRTNGQTSTSGKPIGTVSASRLGVYNEKAVLTDTDQTIEFKFPADLTTMTINTGGWSFPSGI